MDFKFCLLADGRPAFLLAHLSESLNFQANTSDDGGDRDRGKTPVTQSSRKS